MTTHETSDEVVQDETPEMMTVPVTVEGSVRTKELPARAGGFGTRSIDTTPVLILSADPRRKSALIWSDTSNVYLASRQGGATSGGFQWLANVPLSLTACDEVWAAAVTGTTTVHVYSEVWAP